VILIDKSFLVTLQLVVKFIKLDLIMKNRIIELLKSTDRERIDKVIDYLELKSDYFTAPASTAFHGNYPGGLAEHSLNVYNVAMRVKAAMVEMKPELANSLSDESVAIVALLHDLCKTNVYKIEKKNRKVNGRWEEVDAYGVDYSKFPLGHGEKSVIMLLTLGFPLTRDEMMAIRWHMTAWELAFHSAEAKANLNAAKEQCPLLAVLQAADGLASSLLEVTK
jgi:hypothetical protein